MRHFKNVETKTKKLIPTQLNFTTKNSRTAVFKESCALNFK